MGPFLRAPVPGAANGNTARFRGVPSRRDGGLKLATATEVVLDLLLDADDSDEAIEVATRALAHLPAHTAITEKLMQAHAQAGDHLAARRVYTDHLAALETFDLDAPDPSTTAVHDRLVG